MAQIKIPNPCEANASDMSPTERGSFCAHCQKEVIDFTRMSDAEIVKYLKKQKGKACGKLRKDQLNRVLATPAPSSRVAVLAGLLGIFAPLLPQLSQAQPTEQQDVSSFPTQELPVTKIPTKPSSETADAAKQEPNQYTIPIRGQVVDGEGLPLAFCMVVISEGETFIAGTHTDEDGRFRFNLEKESVEGLSIQAQFLGLRSDILPFKKGKTQNLLLTVEDRSVIGGIVLDPRPRMEFRGMGLTISRPNWWGNFTFRQP